MSRFDEMINGLRDDMVIPENVWRGYVRTLETLPEKGDRGRYSGRSKNKYGDKRKRKAAGMTVWKAAALIVGSVTLLGTGVYAAEKYFGILDFFGGIENESAKIPVEAEDLIVPVTQEEQKVEKTAEGMPVDFAVKEAMCDSDSIYVVLEAKAKETGKYFLVPEDAMEEDPVRDCGIDSDMSIGEYASSKNLEIKHVNAGIVNTDELGIGASAIYFQSVSDDVMDLMIESGKTEKEKTLDVLCAGIFWDETMESMEDIMRTEISFTLADISNSTATAYAPSGSAEVPGTGAVIERAEVTQTELGTYLEIFYRDDSEDWSAMPCFRLAEDKAGADLRIRMGSGTEMLQDGTYLWKLSLEKMELGDSIELEAYNEETKEVYGTFELMKEVN